jgi:diguanylate cyclase (GGDEF)-like protein
MQHRKPFFLSLKWKSVILISVTLFLLHLVFSWFFFNKSNKDFEDQLLVEQNKQITILHGLINRSIDITGQFADSLILMKSIQENSIVTDLKQNPANIYNRLSYIMDYYWPKWKIIWGYESVSLYQKENNQVLNWGNFFISMDKLFKYVIKTENIQKVIYCQQQCFLYVAVPVLSQGQLKAVLSVGVPLSDTLINFEKITQADIAIEVKNSISALTHSQHNLPLLTNYLKNSQYKKNKYLVNDAFIFNDIHYRISHIAIEKQAELDQGNTPTYYIINNIEKKYQHLISYQNSIVLITLASLLLIFLMLYYLLEQSVLNIKYISDALPLLSLKYFLNSSTNENHVNKYQQARKVLSQHKQSNYIFDEIDQLQQNSIDLTRRLEQLESERNLAEEQSMWIATHDPLTNLHNRRYFQSEFEKSLNQAKRYQSKVTLFYLDLDNFKIINDTQGHQAGDKLLIAVADSLTKLIRNTDLICRIGGDEFAIITAISDLVGLISLATKINHNLNQICFDESKTAYSVGSSIGIAVYPEHGLTTHQLLANADLAMYKAKETAFNLFHIYDPAIDYNQELKKKLDWQSFIEKALRNNWLQLYYQPILDLQSNQISHYECLLRIIDDEGEITMPFEFIQYAENLGLIELVDITIINLAINKHKELQKTNQKHLKLAINLSGKSINSEKIKIEIKQLLSLTGVAAEKIIFEITETSAVENFTSAKLFINQIKDLGCHIALDDFGTGFSSFYYLKNMSFDYIKIDGAFIKGIETDKEDRVFVKALSEVAHALGKKTIAEFVETENIVAILKELNINYAQGYHIGKPSPKII